MRLESEPDHPREGRRMGGAVASGTGEAVAKAERRRREVRVVVVVVERML